MAELWEWLPIHLVVADRDLHNRRMPNPAPAVPDSTALPSLYADRSFWGMTVTQFFGAFNDNLFKQLVLLLAVTLSAAAATEEGASGPNLQGIAMLVFSVPFILFSTFAGFVADRGSKTRVIVLAKVAEIVVMAFGLLAFFLFDMSGFTGLCVVLFLMGTQSAFFGPAKYGILPEMLRPEDLPRANGFFLMTTFLAIIFGTAAAGWLSDLLAGRLWIVSLFCVGIAMIGTCSSLLVRRLPAANPNLRFQGSSLTIPPDMRALLRGDRLLSITLLVSSLFWLIGGIVQPTVNEFGKNQLQLEKDEYTSYLAAAMGVGIALGCVTAGFLSRGQLRFGLARVGAWGMFASLVLLGIPSTMSEHGHYWGYWGSLPLLVSVGFFAGLFVVPLQVFLQSRPPEDKKGRMIALMNLCSWIGIFLSALLIILIEYVQTQFDWSEASAFVVTAALMLPVALFYRPQNEALGAPVTTQ